MGMIGLALLGVIFGAAGTEFLRARRPEIIKKIEERAKRLVDSLSSSKKGDDERTGKE